MPMTMLDDARNALRAGQRAEASRILSRIIQREPTHGEAWYLLAEAVDDFQQQTYCMGMAVRYNPLQPVIVQPEPAPVLPAYAAPAQHVQPVHAVIPQIVIIDSRSRDEDITFRSAPSRQARIEPRSDYHRPPKRPLSPAEMLLNTALSVLGVAMVVLICFLFVVLVFPLID
jgi:hypothetical protein